MEDVFSLDPHYVNHHLTVEYDVLSGYGDFDDKRFRGQELTLLAPCFNLFDHFSCIFINVFGFSLLQKLMYSFGSGVAESILKLGELLFGEQTFLSIIPIDPQVASASGNWHGRTAKKRNRIFLLIHAG